MKTSEIAKWQAEFRNLRKIYFVQMKGEYTGNYYISKRAAQKEVESLGRGAHVCDAPIHTLKLAAKRWEK